MLVRLAEKEYDIKMRESSPPGEVQVYVDGQVIFSSFGFYEAKKWAKSNFSISDSVLRSLYLDYLADYRKW